MSPWKHVWFLQWEVIFPLNIAEDHYDQVYMCKKQTYFITPLYSDVHIAELLFFEISLQLPDLLMIFYKCQILQCFFLPESYYYYFVSVLFSSIFRFSGLFSDTFRKYTRVRKSERVFFRCRWGNISKSYQLKKLKIRESKKSWHCTFNQVKTTSPMTPCWAMTNTGHRAQITYTLEMRKRNPGVFLRHYFWVQTGQTWIAAA